MKKTFIAMMAMLMTAATAGAQDNKWLQDVRLSGYGMIQFQGQDKVTDKQNTFNLRLARVSLEGRAHNDFAYKAQMQINGNTSEGSSAIRLVDLFAEWQKLDFARVKFGQFKRPFTFENPMHPITQGFMSYSQNVSKLSGFSDRTGEHASNGRDIGLQLQGDLLKLWGHYWFHYQVGVFNGEGINVKDKDNRKDIIGGVWLMPLEGLRLGAFGQDSLCPLCRIFEERLDGSFGVHPQQGYGCRCNEGRQGRRSLCSCYRAHHQEQVSLQGPL